MQTMDPIWQFRTIGVVHSGQKYRFETPRQGVFSACDGEIELFPEYGGDAVVDLAGFERIWVIFCFHLNSGKNWKAKVKPPYPTDGPRRSVFATRSPHRVNPIGLSCVELAGICGNRLYLRHIDMLDGSPVLDIKPYIPEADAFANSAAGWRDEVPEALFLSWNLKYTCEFEEQAALIRDLSGLDLKNFAMVQLANEPFDTSRKRIKKVDRIHWSLGCRTWKIIFCAGSGSKEIIVKKIVSNYRQEELLPGSSDPYSDKDFHRKFIASKGEFFK